jgi:hypothetical protein
VAAGSAASFLERGKLCEQLTTRCRDALIAAALEFLILTMKYDDIPVPPTYG